MDKAELSPVTPKPSTWVSLAEAGADVASTRGGQLATAVALGCAGVGLWNLLLSLSLLARRAAWEWAMRLNDLLTATLRPDVEPMALNFGFHSERLLIVGAVGVSVYCLMRRLARDRHQSLAPAIPVGLALLTAPWLLNAEALAIAIGGDSSWTERAVASVSPLLFGVAVLTALALAGSRRRELCGAVALAAGGLCAATVYWLRSPVHLGYQAACGVAVALLFVLNLAAHRESER